MRWRNRAVATATRPEPIPPIFSFSDAAEFRTRHETATKAEYEFQRRIIEEFNKLQLRLKAWVITAPSAEQPWLGFVLRVDLSGKRRNDSGQQRIDPTGIGQSCKLRIAVRDGTSSPWFPCRRGAEVISLNESWNDMTEMLVYIPDQDAMKFKDCLIPLLDGKLTTRTLHLRKAKNIEVQLQLEASKVTMLTELGALNRLTMGRAGKAGQRAFSYLMDFKKPKEIVDVSAAFPHLADLEKVPDSRLREELKKVIDGFDDDQKEGYRSISALPERIGFVPGGPGAGKTWWVLSMALLAQSGGTRCQTLYLVDINKPADDAADRIQAMYRKFCIEKSVVRVTGWPLTDSTSDHSHQEDDGSITKVLKGADFSESFLREMKPILPRDMEKAPTLDQKAWECYSNQPEEYSAVESALERILATDRDGHDPKADMELLRRSLVPLYHEVLSQADFLATTPATAPRLAGIFNPDLIIFDECAHARELSTMISLAYFEPKAWFFVGDHRQTEPFVAAKSSPYAPQLKLSTMERAEVNEAITHQLLINHRAHGALQRLASDLFYHGAMRSDKSEDGLYPPSTIHLLEWLKGLAGGQLQSGKRIVPRLIINHTLAKHWKAGTSSWNPTHQEFAMQQVDSLLHDRGFLQVDGTEPGTIMILSPYKHAVNCYQGAVNKLPTRQMRRRVQVRTVDTAQGQEADVVFLDMVKNRASPHTENGKRLCVGLTRARQAEVIMMRKSMIFEADGMHGRPLELLPALWNKCASGEEGAILHIVPPPSPRPDSSDGWGPLDPEKSEAGEEQEILHAEPPLPVSSATWGSANHAESEIGNRESGW